MVQSLNSITFSKITAESNSKCSSLAKIPGVPGGGGRKKKKLQTFSLAVSFVFNIFLMPERCLKQQEQQKQNWVNLLCCVFLVPGTLPNLAHVVCPYSSLSYNAEFYCDNPLDIPTLFAFPLLFALLRNVEMPVKQESSVGKMEPREGEDRL